MVLLCRRHHTHHHAGIYDIEIRQGIPWTRLPEWQDPTRPWLTNTTNHPWKLANHITATLTAETTGTERGETTEQPRAA